MKKGDKLNEIMSFIIIFCTVFSYEKSIYKVFQYVIWRGGGKTIKISFVKT